MAKNPKNAVAEEQDDGIREKMIAVNRVTKVVTVSYTHLRAHET